MNTTSPDDSLDPRPDPQTALQRRLRLTAIVSVSASLAGALVLLLMLYLLFRAQPGQSYYEIVQSLTQGQDRLAAAMTLAGSVIVLLAGLVTWLITLYSSHRIAGPFYRFSKNLELEIEQGPVAPIRLRRGDRLQALSAKLARAAEELENYYGEQLRLVDELERCIDADDSDGAARCRDSLRQLAARAGASK